MEEEQDIKLTDTQKKWLEVIIISVLIGFIAIFVISTFFKHDCTCYGVYDGGTYRTTDYNIKKSNCELQCSFFSEKTGIEMSNVKNEIYTNLMWWQNE